MIRQILSKLPVPKAADWGAKVSVCIALRYQKILQPSEHLIRVTDNRVAFGDFSGEHLTIKSSALWHGWSVSFAGNDVEHAEPIIRLAKRNLIALAQRTNRVITPEEAASIVDAAYGEQLQSHIENKILRKHNFDADSFKKIGKLKCTPEIYAKTWERVDREKLSLRFLLCGHDEKKRAHIWLIDGENAPTSYNSIGFWAIGTGAPAALSRIALYLSKYKEFSSLEEAIYVAVTAKFAAESANYVGRSTYATVEKHMWEKDDSIFLGDNAIEALRAAWELHGIPPVPDYVPRGLKIHLRKMAKVAERHLKKLEKVKQSTARKAAGPR